MDCLTSVALFVILLIGGGLLACTLVNNITEKNKLAARLLEEIRNIKPKKKKLVDIEAGEPKQQVTFSPQNQVKEFHKEDPIKKKNQTKIKSPKTNKSKTKQPKVKTSDYFSQAFGH